ncbi:transposase [Chryseobacterium sp. G0186]|uniref:transposase n=1 Tax=Chryseobacterium sp. G0186 TaxID=2487064 RepID=UPI0026C3B4E8
MNSTALRVCRNQRIHNHKVFKGLAERRKSSMGWFYGFKLHLVCNEKGELLSLYYFKLRLTRTQVNIIKNILKLRNPGTVINYFYILLLKIYK